MVIQRVFLLFSALTGERNFVLAIFPQLIPHVFTSHEQLYGKFEATLKSAILTAKSRARNGTRQNFVLCWCCFLRQVTTTA